MYRGPDKRWIENYTNENAEHLLKNGSHREPDCIHVER